MARPTSTTPQMSERPSGERLTVVVRQPTTDTAGDLAALPGVASVELESREGDAVVFVVRSRTATSAAVRRAIKAYAAEANLTVVLDALHGDTRRPKTSAWASVATDVGGASMDDIGTAVNRPPSIRKPEETAMSASFTVPPQAQRTARHGTATTVAVGIVSGAAVLGLVVGAITFGALTFAFGLAGTVAQQYNVSVSAADMRVAEQLSHFWWVFAALAVASVGAAAIVVVKTASSLRSAQ